MRRAERKTNLKNESKVGDFWDNIKCNTIHIIGVQEGGEREGYQTCMWRNYDWKTPKLEEGNKYPGTGSTEGPKQDEHKQTHTKTYHN